MTRDDNLKDDTTTTSNTSNKRVADVLRLIDNMYFPILSDMYVSLLKECADLKDIVGGAEVHAHMNNHTISAGSHIVAHHQHSLPPPRRLLLANRLLLMYAYCGHLDSAHFISWLIMFAAHVDYNSPQEALHLIPSVLRACIHTEDFGLGKQVHGLVFKLGNTDDNILCSSFIELYANFRCLDELIFEVVIELFKKMSRADVKKNGFTISTVLRAYGRGLCGEQVHANAIKLGVVESDIYVQCSLVDMYGKCGLMKDSRMAFNWRKSSSKRNEICWSVMLNT
ncbi:hypothetical protein MKW98_027981 [Papaver atlanticum]|uniref:Pentatricopeptide repeat-containing protein n=1 Tax=Papaver atlanticum TaxID=357466 RepID=A0AAD4XRE0_9MAGN|nr:hypothetical protein MKW98_027981 [Papaver atlanticum]